MTTTTVTEEEPFVFGTPGPTPTTARHTRSMTREGRGRPGASPSRRMSTPKPPGGDEDDGESATSERWKDPLGGSHFLEDEDLNKAIEEELNSNANTFEGYERKGKAESPLIRAKRCQNDMAQPMSFGKATSRKHSPGTEEEDTPPVITEVMDLEEGMTDQIEETMKKKTGTEEISGQCPTTSSPSGFNNQRSSTHPRKQTSSYGFTKSTYGSKLHKYRRRSR